VGLNDAAANAFEPRRIVPIRVAAHYGVDPADRLMAEGTQAGSSAVAVARGAEVVRQTRHPPTCWHAQRWRGSVY